MPRHGSSVATVVTPCSTLPNDTGTQPHSNRWFKKLTTVLADGSGRRLATHLAFLLLPLLIVSPALATDSLKPNVQVTPKPFRQDDTFMDVSFTAPVTTTRGYFYFARWQTRAPRSTLPYGCSPSSQLNPLGRLAREGTRITLRLQPERSLGDSFCPGPSQVLVFMQKGELGHVAADASRETYRQVADYRFRVFRPV